MYPPKKGTRCSSICLAMQKFGYTIGNRLENFRCVLNEGHEEDHNKDGLYWRNNGEFSSKMLCCKRATLEQLRKLSTEATPGPWDTWEIEDEEGNKTGGIKAIGLTFPALPEFNVGETNCSPEDASLIVAMRNSFEKLLIIAEKARALLDGGLHSCLLPLQEKPCRGCVGEQDLREALAKFDS
jgi:hypothetical protein